MRFDFLSVLVVFILNCCHSFGCERRHSVSTYASILVLLLYFFYGPVLQGVRETLYSSLSLEEIIEPSFGALRKGTGITVLSLLNHNLV